jgi:hypothetical protein
MARPVRRVRQDLRDLRARQASIGAGRLIWAAAITRTMRFRLTILRTSRRLTTTGRTRRIWIPQIGRSWLKPEQRVPLEQPVQLAQLEPARLVRRARPVQLERRVRQELTVPPAQRVRLALRAQRAEKAQLELQVRPAQRERLVRREHLVRLV